MENANTARSTVNVPVSLVDSGDEIYLPVWQNYFRVVSVARKPNRFVVKTEDGDRYAFDVARIVRVRRRSV